MKVTSVNRCLYWLPSHWVIGRERTIPPTQRRQCQLHCLEFLASLGIMGTSSKLFLWSKGRWHKPPAHLTETFSNLFCEIPASKIWFWVPAGFMLKSLYPSILTWPWTEALNCHLPISSFAYIALLIADGLTKLDLVICVPTPDRKAAITAHKI